MDQPLTTIKGKADEITKHGRRTDSSDSQGSLQGSSGGVKTNVFEGGKARKAELHEQNLSDKEWHEQAKQKIPEDYIADNPDAELDAHRIRYLFDAQTVPESELQIKHELDNALSEAQNRRFDAASLLMRKSAN